MERGDSLKRNLPQDDSIADISQAKGEEQENGPSKKREEGQQGMIDAAVMESPESTPSIEDQVVKAPASDDAPSDAKTPRLSLQNSLERSNSVENESADIQPSASSSQGSDLVQNETVDMQPAASSSQNLKDEELLKKFYRLAAFLRESLNSGINTLEKLHNAVDKAKMKHSISFTSSKRQSYKCDLNVNSVLVSTGEGPSRKAAKHNSYENALILFSDPYLKIVNPYHPYLKSSSTPFPDKARFDINPPMIPPKKHGNQSDFFAKLQDDFTQYIRSGNQEDMVYPASLLSKEERTYIHKKAKRMGLKARSRGSNGNHGNPEERCIVVGRK